MRPGIIRTCKTPGFAVTIAMSCRVMSSIDLKEDQHLSNPVTRREFLNLIAATGGTAAVLGITGALGMIPSSAAASVPDLLRLSNQNRKVVILGAGISGLTVAYELG